MTELTELESADAYCRHLTRRHYENFSVISAFLPKDIRAHLSRVYGFCRTTDDFGDESGRSGLARLEAWRAEVEACFDPGSAPIHPVLIALSVTIREFGFDRGPFLDLILANVQDQTVAAYQTWEELRAYCMLSAAPVGRMVLTVFGVKSARAEKLSDDVCIGLQLANHTQDVKRDAARGRSYLIQDVAQTEGVRAAIEDLTARAEALLASGKELESMVPFHLRAQLSLYRLGGMEVLKGIRALDFGTDVRRPVVPTPRKVALLAQAVRESVSTMKHAPRPLNCMGED